MKQGILTIVAPIIEGGEDVLADSLRSLQPARSPLSELDDLHFGSFSIVKHDALPARLVFEMSFDGPREAFVDELVAQIPNELDAIFKFCEDYPVTGARLPQPVKNYLLDRDVGADALYIGLPGRTVGQILEETSLCDEV